MKPSSECQYKGGAYQPACAELHDIGWCRRQVKAPSPPHSLLLFAVLPSLCSHVPLSSSSSSLFSSFSSSFLTSFCFSSCSCSSPTLPRIFFECSSSSTFCPPHSSALAAPRPPSDLPHSFCSCCSSSSCFLSFSLFIVLAVHCALGRHHPTLGQHSSCRCRLS